MKLSDYIHSNPCNHYDYVGSSWGDFINEDGSRSLTKKQVLDLLSNLQEFDGQMLERHPLDGVEFDENGWQISGYYIEGNKIGYASHLVNEIVLVESE